MLAHQMSHNMSTLNRRTLNMSFPNTRFLLDVPRALDLHFLAMAPKPLSTNTA